MLQYPYSNVFLLSYYSHSFSFTGQGIWKTSSEIFRKIESVGQTRDTRDILYFGIESNKNNDIKYIIVKLDDLQDHSKRSRS